MKASNDHGSNRDTAAAAAGAAWGSRLVRETVDLCGAARAWLHDLAHVAAEAQVVLVDLIPSGLSPVHIDPRAVRAMLEALIQNGIETSPAGGKVTVTAGGHASGVWITVIDEGDGIEPGALNQLFHPFGIMRRPGDTARSGMAGGRAAPPVWGAPATVERPGGSF